MAEPSTKVPECVTSEPELQPLSDKLRQRCVQRALGALEMLPRPKALAPGPEPNGKTKKYDQ